MATIGNRKVKDLIDNQTQEPVYIKGHAQATFMSDGATVEDAINNLLVNGIGDSGSSGSSETSSILAEPNTVVKRDGLGQIYANAFIDENSMIWVTPTSSIDTIESADRIIQTQIDDLDEIREGASKGATAVQPSSLSTVATSGSYTDLSNKPSIPAAITETSVSNWGFTKNSGTITSVKANGTSVATSGEANIPAASTSAYGVTKLSTSTSSTSTTLAATASAVKSAYDLANGKQDKLTSGTNIKTVNGQSLLGSGNITIEGGNSDANIQAVDTGDVLDDVNIEYCTKSYIDGLVGDINSVLESIISGGNASIFPITLTLGNNGQTAVDLYNYVVQNHTSGLYHFKENEIVKYNSEIISDFYYSNGSIIYTYFGGGTLTVNQSGMVALDGGAGN